MNSIYDWSLIASENASADGMINWAEGQPPSSVNDSARAMMQRLREYISDQGGMIETHFMVSNFENKTSIHLQTKTAITAYTDGIVVRFKSQGVNRGMTMVVLNQLSPRPVYKVTQNGIERLSGGEIQNGGLYELVYHHGIAGKNLDGWYLTNPTNVRPKSFPSGFIAAFAMETLPDGWILCDGKIYFRKDYRSLFEAIGEIWGRGDGYTTFRVPDLRGMFLRGLDGWRGIDRGRTLGSQQDDSFKAHGHEGETDEEGEHTHEYVTTARARGGHSGAKGLTPSFSSLTTEITKSAGMHKHAVFIRETGEQETRPINIAVVYAIKT